MYAMAYKEKNQWLYTIKYADTSHYRVNSFSIKTENFAYECVLYKFHLAQEKILYNS